MHCSRLFQSQKTISLLNGLVGRISFSTKLGSMKYVGALDQGTSSTRFILFDKTGKNVASHQVEFKQKTPKPGWVEHNPRDLINTSRECIEKCMENFDKNDVLSIGITNQRETTCVWDSKTGEPLHNAIVWNDSRTAEICSELENVPGVGEDIRKLCGLPISTYFSATKLKWLILNSEKVQNAIKDGRCMFGTVDSWLIWNLTGGAGKGIHVTDVTNASRTMFMNINTGEWDDELKKRFDVPGEAKLEKVKFPEIRTNSEKYGTIADGALEGVPISGCIGDQQGAMVGHLCFDRGSAKNTYGTGCFLLMNTGKDVVQSQHGLLSTVCFDIGKGRRYALEGSVAHAGSAVKFLRDNLGIASSASEISKLASEVDDTGGVYFVPAFSGLLAPYWKTDARACIVGMSLYTQKKHLARAVLEAACYQTRDVLEAMTADMGGVKMSKLRIDGGMTNSDLLCQFQADLCSFDVVRPEMLENTALGAAICAGLSVGYWESEEDIVANITNETQCFSPKTGAHEELYAGWKHAVTRSFA